MSNELTIYRGNNWKLTKNFIQIFPRRPLGFLQPELKRSIFCHLQVQACRSRVLLQAPRISPFKTRWGPALWSEAPLPGRQARTIRTVVEGPGAESPRLSAEPADHLVSELLLQPPPQSYRWVNHGAVLWHPDLSPLDDSTVGGRASQFQL